ncbi:penicillin-binding transpeptidase domain-containing protein [Iamia majanohamensis]|uniref:Penicillin-binding transpeptidase domain-containing protein n=1 Tax=Iamia majanohamensis TaxID=467976 RepID=A0AAF0BXU0_9ACTN|nr:penicillin-binding transpeptidase domain-containing protein [Iamia majanohamensis]WCO69174.1 penicillin-binding transpeptidase domain-containing protein [Iamia majanohamensis]
MRAPGGSRRKAAVIAAGVAAVVALGVAAFLVLDDEGDGGGSTTTLPPQVAEATRAAEAFARAVTDGRPGQGGTVQPADQVDQEFLLALEGLGQATLETTAGEVTVDGDRGEAAMETTWTVGGSAWTTPGRLGLVRVDAGGDGTWRAEWSLAALDERLRPGDTLAADSTAPTRGMILSADGRRLAGDASVVVVGVQPQRATDVAALTTRLQELLGIDGAELASRIAAAAPDAFVEVTTLREEEYAPLRDQLQPLPGTVFRREDQSLAVEPGFAGPVLGRVAPATEEQVAESDGRLQPGQLTGSGGIQEAFDERLSGTSGLEVSVTHAEAGGEAPEGSTTTAPPDAGTTEVLEEVPPVDGETVTTTLDIDVQQAAEAALAGQSTISTLVAIRPSTGEVLADANVNDGGFDYGSRAQVPPGSTFKVVSTLAHLRKGLTPEQVVPCPQTIDVGGREFGNAGDFALGDVPFSLDFARSCNTAFAGLADDLAPDDLTDAAAGFGIGVEWTTGIPTNTGSVPPTEGLVDAAAASIGQGRIVVAPVDMAGVAATVATGRWRAPVIVSDPPVAIPEERPLAEGEAETLRALMRGVVTEGSGEALLGVPGEPVMAKTGTAEYGSGDPPPTHAWIIGFQGDLAFAVFVEDGLSGGAVAGPVAASFLTALAGG